MKLLLLLTVCLVAVSSMSIVDRAAGRINGQDGWYVPTIDGSLKWVTMSEAEEQLAAYETLNELEAIERISLNAVNFYLYTQRNPNDGQVIKTTRESVDASNFNPELPTRITIHGWNANYKDGVNTGIRAAWFLFGDYNMIAVDWSRGRSLEYASSVAAVASTGAKIANLVDFLVKEYGMSLETLEVVGFSLGAHVAGQTAKQVSTGKVQKVIGLDPAMPLMSYDKPAKRLSSNDAIYVESIQTNGGTLGYKKPIGRAAFYPNGGKSQPGCGLDLTGGCSHTRAVSYYIESLKMDNFPSMKCQSYEYANKKDCGSTYSSVSMGSVQNQLMAVGEFYVPVNKQSPYGFGEVNVPPTQSPVEPTTSEPETTEIPTTTEVNDSTSSAPVEETTTSEPETTEIPTTTEVNDSTSSAPVEEPTVTPSPPEDDKQSGSRTNIYVLNLIYINSHVNKQQ